MASLARQEVNRGQSSLKQSTVNEDSWKREREYIFFIDYFFVLYITLQVQIAHLLNPKGGMYGCHLLPAG